MTSDAPRRLLLTGGSSGIGFEAARDLIARGHELTILCRNKARAEQTLNALSGKVQTLVCDLADLWAVERITAELLVSGKPLDGLVLNAGLQYAGDPRPRWNHQGIELTVAVNHLAHQCIAMRLLPLLRRSSSPRLVITASEVHNPGSGGGRVGRPAALGDLAGLRAGAGFLMLDGSARFDADKAYKDSKLCNVLMARELARQLDGALPVIGWSPGLVITPGGGFFRENRRRNPIGMAAFGFAARDLLRITETSESAGRLLAHLVTDNTVEPGFSYTRNRLVRRGVHQPELADTSEEASDMHKATELWCLSQALIDRSLKV